MASRRRKKRLKKQAAKNRRKLARHQPDEEIAFGPMRIARYGVINVLENNASAEEMAEFKKRAGGRFESVCRDISTEVQICREIAERVNPLDLLLRSYWNWFANSFGAPNEESAQPKARIEAFQLLEYVQKLLYAFGSAHNSLEVSDAEFDRLRESTNRIFEKLGLEYFVCRSGLLAQRPDYDVNFDAYAVRAEMNWLSVRGHRYLSQEAEYFRSILSTQALLLDEIYHLKLDQLVEGLALLLDSLTKGVGKALAELHAFRAESLDAIAADSSTRGLCLQDAMDKVVVKNGWVERKEKLSSELFGTALFDVKEITSWPDDFIEDLSCGLAEDGRFSLDSSNAGWPTAESLLRSKPFIRIQNRSYCFFVRGLTDYLYRAIEFGIRKRVSNFDRWTRGQKRASEQLTADLFSRLLPSAKIVIDAHYWATSAIERTSTECDILAIFDRTLFVIEVKAGRYTHKPPGRKILDHLKSIKELIESAAIQANRFVDNLRAQGSLEIFDAKGEVQMVVNHSDFDQVFRCCVSLDQIDDIASRSEDLRKLKIAIGPHPVWTLSINDLLVLADVFVNPLVFIDYVGERLRAFESEHCHVSDELDHVGLYFKHNRYSMLADSYAPMHCEGWAGYRDEFDRYYGQKWIGKSGSLPSAELPSWLNQLIYCLSKAGLPGRVCAATRLLEMDGETRTQFGGWVVRARKLQKQCKRPRPLSTMGDVRVTAFIDQFSLKNGLSFAEAREFTMGHMVLENEHDRLLLYLDCKPSGEIDQVVHQIITSQDVDNAGRDRLRQAAENLRNSRAGLDRRDVIKCKK